MKLFSKENPPISVEQARERHRHVKDMLRGFSENKIRFRSMNEETRKKMESSDPVKRVRLVEDLKTESTFLRNWIGEKEFMVVLEAKGITEDFLTKDKFFYSVSNPPENSTIGAEALAEARNAKLVSENGLVALANASMEKRNNGEDCKNAFFALKTKLISKIKYCEIQINFLKPWIHKNKHKEAIEMSGLTTPTAIIKALVTIIDRVKNTGVQLEGDEFKIFAAVRDMVNS